MSPSTDNFIHSLVEMSKAFEELPSVKSELDQAKAEADTLARSVQAREESIARLKAEIEAKNETIRKVEAERDDAELRFLEADDRTHKALDFIKTSFGSAGSLIQALEPMKEEPKVDPIQHASSSMVSGVDGIDNTTDASTAEASSSTAPTAPEPTPMAPVSAYEQGQSAVDPTSDGANVGDNMSQAASAHGNTLVTIDNVGYHNEPKVNGTDWSEWDRWAERMSARYGKGSWPVREHLTQTAAQ